MKAGLLYMYNLFTCLITLCYYLMMSGSWVPYKMWIRRTVRQQSKQNTYFFKFQIIVLYF